MSMHRLADGSTEANSLRWSPLSPVRGTDGIVGWVPHRCLVGDSGFEKVARCRVDLTDRYSQRTWAGRRRLDPVPAARSLRPAQPWRRTFAALANGPSQIIGRIAPPRAASPTKSVRPTRPAAPA